MAVKGVSILMACLLLALSGCLSPDTPQEPPAPAPTSTLEAKIVFVNSQDTRAAEEWQNHTTAMEDCIHTANERLSAITSLGNCSMEKTRYAAEAVHAENCTPVFTAAQSFVLNHSQQFPENGSLALAYISQNLAAMKDNLDVARDTRDYVCNRTGDATGSDE